MTLDLSEDGPVFSALDEMMMKLVDEGADERRKNRQDRVATRLDSHEMDRTATKVATLAIKNSVMQ